MTKQDILIIHGTDYKEMAKQILTRADVAALIGDRDKQVALKPNLASANAPSTGATTHPSCWPEPSSIYRNTVFTTSA